MRAEVDLAAVDMRRLAADKLEKYKSVKPRSVHFPSQN
jgi:hypothetical protein